MRLFISSLGLGTGTGGGGEIGIPLPPADLSIAEAEIIEMPEYGELQPNDVRLVYLIGHSQIAGKGNNADATDDERAYNQAVMWNGSSYSNFSVPSTGEHGRELGISAYYKDYIDASHAEKLHMAKLVVRGAAPFSILILGTRYFNNFWNNFFVPSINSVISSGKKPVVHFIFDMFLGFEIIGNSFAQRHDLQASLNSIMFLLNRQNLNMSLTGDVEPAGCQGFPNNVYGNDYLEAYVATNPTYLKYTDKFEQPTNDGCHVGYIGLMHCAEQHLAEIASQPLLRFENLIETIPDCTLITYKANPNQADVLSVKMDVTFDALVQSDGVQLDQRNTDEIGVDIRFFRTGFCSIIGSLSGITSFEAPYAGIFGEFELIEKYASTLNYIDIRGNSLQIVTNLADYSNNMQLQFIVNGGVLNGTLLMADSQVGLTTAAQTNYSTLISRGWTIDVPYPV